MIVFQRFVIYIYICIVQYYTLSAQEYIIIYIKLERILYILTQNGPERTYMQMNTMREYNVVLV